MLKHKGKLAAAVVAGGLTAGLLLTGTFAWQSINQRAMNEVMAETNPGGRLHDDFNGKNKDIYVENFTDELDGMPIFARIRLYEYMETGVGAGDPSAPDRDTEITVLGKADADINDSSTWAIHQFGADVASNDHLTFHDYITWDEDGGSTVYMPTFNKNKDSLISDINGTLAGPDGYRPGDENDTTDRYQDYQTYNLGDTVTGNAIYDADDNDVDEVDDYLAPDDVNGGVLVNPGGSAVDGEHYQLTQETHTAQYTQDCTVITIDQWEALDPQEQVGNYWVYDTDGWAYWAAPIMPGTATGLLLDGISVMTAPDQEWYYAIDAVAQFATDHGWGTKDGQDGFYAEENGGMQDRGAAVLEQAAESLNNKITISLNNTVKDIATVDSFVAQPGDKARFSVTARINGVEHQLTSEELEDVVWTISGIGAGTSSIASPYVYKTSYHTTNYDFSHNSALLTIDEDVAAGTTLTVAAQYQGFTDRVEVQVDNLGYEDLGSVIPTSLTTVTIDGYKWYVLAKDGDQVLLWADDSVGTTLYGSDGTTGYILPWNTSTVKNYLNTTVWNKLVKLKQPGVAVSTPLTTWDGKGTNINTNWVSTTDSIFLLTEADLYGTSSLVLSWTELGGAVYSSRTTELKDYTYQVDGVGQRLAQDVEMRKADTMLRYGAGKWSFAGAFLRSIDGYRGAAGAQGSCVVRPAMWVNLNVPDAQP